MTGQRLGQYLKDNIFDPLGMNDTAFKIGEAQRQRLAKIHARTPDGLVATDTEIPQEPEFEMGGGGLYGTVGDYPKFAQVFLHDGTFNGVQILKPETVKLMGQNAAGEVRVRPLKTAQPPISNDVDFIDGMQWGLSFLINPEPLPSGRSAGSLAWAGPGELLIIGSIPRKASRASMRRRSCRSSTRSPRRPSRRSRRRCIGRFSRSERTSIWRPSDGSGHRPLAFAIVGAGRAANAVPGPFLWHRGHDARHGTGATPALPNARQRPP